MKVTNSETRPLGMNFDYRRKPLAAYSLRRQGGLHHGPRVPHTECERCIRAAAGAPADGTAVPIVVDRARMFGIDQARILVPHKFLHDQEHVFLAFIDEYFGIPLVRLLHLSVPEVV